MTTGNIIGFTICVAFPILLCIAFTPVRNWKIIWGAVAAWVVLFGSLLGLIVLLHGAVA